VEANPAAGKLLNKPIKRLAGRAFAELFNAEGAKAVQAQLAQVRAAGRAEDLIARLNEGGQETVVGSSMFRQESSSHFLVRLSPLQAGVAQPKSGSKLIRVFENLPDGFVVTDLDRRIITANAAFIDLAELTSEEQARGEQLDRWIGRPGVDLDTLIANLREHGSVRNFNTIVRGEYGANDEVEISAVSVLTGEHPCYGFTIRNTGGRKPVQPRRPRELPRSVEQLTQLVGRVTLKELVRETTDVIERLCIEAALELTGDNRASAAEMLGLSRQSLYSKLRRFGLGDLNSDDER
jgi:transcriptional regulator PpsR